MDINELVYTNKNKKKLRMLLSDCSFHSFSIGRFSTVHVYIVHELTLSMSRINLLRTCRLLLAIADIRHAMIVYKRQCLQQRRSLLMNCF